MPIYFLIWMFFRLVWDSCDCCKICGRMEGEFCGGQFNHYGRCGQGLKCHMTRAYSVFGMCVVDTTSPASAFSYSANNKSAPASYDTKLQKPLNSERKKDDGTKKRDLMKLQELPGSMVVLPSYKINGTSTIYGHRFSVQIFGVQNCSYFKILKPTMLLFELIPDFDRNIFGMLI